MSTEFAEIQEHEVDPAENGIAPSFMKLRRSETILSTQTAPVRDDIVNEMVENSNLSIEADNHLLAVQNDIIKLLQSFLALNNVDVGDERDVQYWEHSLKLYESVECTRRSQLLKDMSFTWALKSDLEKERNSNPALLFGPERMDMLVRKCIRSYILGKSRK